jgi:hypothetical protein
MFVVVAIIFVTIAFHYLLSYNKYRPTIATFLLQLFSCYNIYLLVVVIFILQLSSYCSYHPSITIVQWLISTKYILKSDMNKNLTKVKSIAFKLDYLIFIKLILNIFFYIQEIKAKQIYIYIYGLQPLIKIHCISPWHKYQKVYGFFPTSHTPIFLESHT